MSNSVVIAFDKNSKNRFRRALEGQFSYKKLSAAEWHQFVQNYNYDDGNAPLKWIIDQAHCDKGTALCLYWHLQTYLLCQQDRYPGYEEQFNILKKIEQHYLAGFYQNEQFAFEPRDNFLDSRINTSCIPELMLRKTPGVAFDRESVEFAWLRRPDAKESKTIERKISNAIDIIRKFQADYKHDDAVRSVEAIAHAVAHWHESGLDVAQAKVLSYLWLDSLHK